MCRYFFVFNSGYYPCFSGLRPLFLDRYQQQRMTVPMDIDFSAFKSPERKVQDSDRKKALHDAVEHLRKLTVGERRATPRDELPHFLRKQAG